MILCAASASDIADELGLPTCNLPKGHTGWHAAMRSDGGCIWLQIEIEEFFVGLAFWGIF